MRLVSKRERRRKEVIFFIGRSVFYKRSNRRNNQRNFFTRTVAFQVSRFVSHERSIIRIVEHWFRIISGPMNYTAISDWTTGIIHCWLDENELLSFFFGFFVMDSPDPRIEICPFIVYRVRWKWKKENCSYEASGLTLLKCFTNYLFLGNKFFYDPW